MTTAEEDETPTTWAELGASVGLDRRVTKAIAKLNWVTPTLVQAKSLPLSFAGKDMLVRARTGSGKTAAFCVPLLHKLLAEKASAKSGAVGDAAPGVRALVLVPTRELCEQVCVCARKFSKSIRPSPARANNNTQPRSLPFCDAALRPHHRCSVTSGI